LYATAAFFNFEEAMQTTYVIDCCINILQMKKTLFFCVFVLMYSFAATAQSFSITTDGSTGDASSMLDVKSTSKGVLVPRMSKAQKNAIIAPAVGLLVYQNAPDSIGFHYYNGTAWLWLAANVTPGWQITGNSGIDTATNFLGTINNMPLRFKLLNLWAGQWDIAKDNYFIGQSSGQSNTTGQSNVGVGSNALFRNTTSSFNVAVGSYALLNHKLNGNAFNTAIGASALEQDSTGFQNTGIGTSSFRFNKTGTYNSGLGINSGYYQRGSTNTFVGAYSGFGERINLANQVLNIGSNNTGVGGGSLYRIANGNHNVAIGEDALFNDSSGSHNVAIGNEALYRNEASDFNIAIGNYALQNHKRVGWTFNVAVGASAMEQDSSGFQNTGVGVSSFRFNKTGIENTGVGINSGYYQKGSSNTFLGSYSGFGSTTIAADTGIHNTGIGAYSLYNSGNGNRNIASGNYALYNNTGGSNNAAFGYFSLENNTTGSNNTAIGYNANTSAGTLNNAAAIGANAYVTQSNSLILGSINGTNGATANTNIGIGTTAPVARLHVADSSVLFSATGLVPATQGNPPVSGAGRRMMWYADKAAFRAGYVGNNNWNKDSIGNYSFATGRDTRATGDYSTAMGWATIARGDFSTAMGYNATASGFYSTAMGGFTTASDSYSTAMGYNTIANANISTAMGASTTASGNFSTSMGRFTTASGFISSAIGDSTIAGGDFSTAMGNRTISRGYAGTVLGMFNNPILVGNQTSITATTPLFIIGNGDNISTRSNAMVVRKDGRVGIGTDAPTASLDVDANFKLGANGSILNEIIRSNETYDIPSLASGAVDIQTFAVPNVVVNSIVSVSPVNALPDGITISYARVSAAGTVEIKVVNAGTATQNPASNVFLFVIIR
jgi:trimeric autotransporter adhesin